MFYSKTKHGEREMESIFAILKGGCFIKMSCSWKKGNLHKSVLLSQFNWKIKFFSIHFGHIPVSVALFLNYFLTSINHFNKTIDTTKIQTPFFVFKSLFIKELIYFSIKWGSQHIYSSELNIITCDNKYEMHV